MRALYTGASGMMAQQMNVDSIANNLSNVNTNSFKKNRVEFKDMLYDTIQKSGKAEENGKPVNIQIGLGVMPGATQKSFNIGNMEPTENPLDLFIEGEGFFAVKEPNGQTYYTRDGSLKLGANSDGSMMLTTSDGYPVLDTSDNPIVIDVRDPSKIEIDGNGLITYIDSTGTKTTSEQPIKVVKFMNRAGLEAKGLNFYARTDASGEPINEADIDVTEGENNKSVLRQGFLETSNVQIVEEMVKLIVAQRAYEINSKTVQAADEMLGMADNLRR